MYTVRHCIYFEVYDNFLINYFVLHSLNIYLEFTYNLNKIGQKEAWKGKHYGGCKLANVQIKSQTPKSKWLMDMISNPVSILNFTIFAELLDTQRGNVTAKDLMFMHKSYIKEMQICPFYEEAIMTTCLFDLKKRIKIPRNGMKNIYFVTL